jgi:putative nucleotidyltransferase with HDIG domain
MFKALKNFRLYFKKLITLGVFILAVTLVVIMLPRERRFAYEYSKGSPWANEDLTARFGFSILKTPAELQNERDSVEKNLAPYFTNDDFISASNLSRFQSEFEKKWIAYSTAEFRIPVDVDYLEHNKFSSHRMLQDYYHTLINAQLERVYLKGIIRIPESEELNLGPDSYINVVKGQLSERAAVEQLYTIKEAYELVYGEMNNTLSNDSRRITQRYQRFFEDLDLRDYLQENVLFDPEKTALERTAQLNTISETKGFIQEGELLISRGIIVTSESYQVLESYKYEFEKQRGNVSNILAWVGRILLTAISFLVVYLFLYNFRKEVLQSFVKTSFILFMMVLMIFIASMVAGFEKKFYYVVPFTILPIIIRTFYDERVGLFIHIITVLMAGFMALNSFDFIFLNIIAGIVAIFSLTHLYHRSRFFLSAFLVVLTYSITYFGISVVKEGSFSQLELSNFGYFGLNGVFTLLSFLLIYIFEKTFGFLSDTTLMELSDTNQPLLRKLAENAPATFQHSMQVANLSEEAIRHIGGNPLLVRTGALYHDIGKMVDASYFTENQAGGPNPHKDKDLKESARIIINHVTLGEEMALKHKLPKPIIDFILMHHGTSTTKWFYKTYQNQHPNEDVDPKDFQYPGPRPLTKETAVLMMADTVEAASRSLESYSEDTISELVERLVQSQMNEGQFEDADITFKEIKKVKEVFKARLNTIYHARIAYPK